MTAVPPATTSEARAEAADVTPEQRNISTTNSNAQRASWQAQLQARVQRAWLRPASTQAGIDCIAYVTQTVGGEVTNARVGQCNGDAAARESIQGAVFRASPLPPPPDSALFQRNLEIQFKP